MKYTMKGIRPYMQKIAEHFQSIGLRYAFNEFFDNMTTLAIYNIITSIYNIFEDGFINDVTRIYLSVDIPLILH